MEFISPPTPDHFKFRLKDLVKRKKGSWHGIIVGWYSSEHTPEGYNVMSLAEYGCVHVEPERTLEPWDGVYEMDPRAAVLISESLNGSKQFLMMPNVGTAVARVPIRAIRANDVSAKKAEWGDTWNSEVQYFNIGREIQLLDLSRDITVFDYPGVDRTDLISSDGRLSKIMISVSGTIEEEFFDIDVSEYLASRLDVVCLTTPLQIQQGWRGTDLTFKHTLESSTKQWGGESSRLLKALGEHKLEVNCDVKWRVNICTGEMRLFLGVCLVGMEHPLAKYQFPEKKILEDLRFQAVAFSPEIYFDKQK